MIERTVRVRISGVQYTERLYRYVERFFERSGRTDWPTVRRCARALGLPQSEVMQQIADDERLDTTYYNVGYRVPDGDWFVESYCPLPSEATIEGEVRDGA